MDMKELTDEACLCGLRAKQEGIQGVPWNDLRFRELVMGDDVSVGDIPTLAKAWQKGNRTLLFSDLKPGDLFKIARVPTNTGWSTDIWRKRGDTCDMYTAICNTDSRKVMYVGPNVVVVEWPTGRKHTVV